MIKDIISKEEFVSCLDDVKNVLQYQKDLNIFFGKHDIDGYLYQPDCVYDTMKLLHMIFGKADKDEYIERFCYDTWFGKKVINGLFMDESGKNVTITTAEDLYDLLIALENH